ncbi:GntR family transcriptional regulator [Paenibacillus sonchi]|uniref:GntR family transcriptional regulator n=1 Tax=Paenibacillus sonchi TaxID=373687 RepID=UPI001F3FA371|nr:GntR family transcriptional regulator [Paenibacillus sonchi]
MSIKAEIMNTLKHEILTLSLKPGTILSETALSERFQISRTPLRDVLKQLALESYTDIYPKKGISSPILILNPLNKLHICAAHWKKRS